jgi:hypothetical protein
VSVSTAMGRLPRGGSAVSRWMRRLIVCTVGAVFVLDGFLVGQLTRVGEPGRALGLADVAFGLVVVLFGVSLFALFTVMMFNWPKFLVAPHLRSEWGALVDWRYRRRRT